MTFSFKYISMKKLLIILSIYLLTIQLNAQNYILDTTFNVEFNFFDEYSFNTSITSMVSIDNGDFLIAGRFNDDILQIGYCIKFDSTGIVDYSYDIYHSADNLYTITKVNEYLYSYWAFDGFGRCNIDGTHDTTGWYENLYSIDICHFSRDFAVLDDSSLITGANFCDPFDTLGYSNNQVIHILPDGNIDQLFQFFTNDVIYGVVKYDDERLLVYGKFTQYDSTNIKWICRIFNNGELDTTFNTCIEYGISYISYIEPNGKIILTGNIDLSNSSEYDSLSIVRLLPNGELDTTFNNFNTTPIYNFVYFVCPTHDEESYIFSGRFNYYQGYERNNIVKVDLNGFIDTTAFNNGGIDFNPAYPGNIPDYYIHTNVKQGANNTYYLFGSFNSYNGQFVNPIIRIKEDYTIIEEVGYKKQNYFKLYPNPATDIINVSIDKSVKEKVSISVYNINGTLIKSLPTNYPNKTISISTKDFAPGIYFCEVKGNDFISREKFVVVR